MIEGDSAQHTVNMFSSGAFRVGADAPGGPHSKTDFFQTKKRSRLTGSVLCSWGYSIAFFLRLRVRVRIMAAPVREVTHRAAHRPSLDSSAVRGEALERLKMMT